MEITSAWTTGNLAVSGQYQPSSPDLALRYPDATEDSTTGKKTGVFEGSATNFLYTDLKNRICEAFGVNPDAIWGDSRERKFTNPRYMLSHVCTENPILMGVLIGETGRNPAEIRRMNHKHLSMMVENEYRNVYNHVIGG